MRVLVTGHHGYIGSVLAPVLATAGHDVIGLDAFFYEGCDFIDDGSALASLRLDIRDVPSELLEGYDAIVHLAALSNDPLGELSPQLARAINLDATIALARRAKEAGVARFLFASSCSLYGAAAADDYVSEDAPLRPLTAYAESKARAEDGLANVAGDGFSPVFMRNATAYGVSPRLRFDVVLNNLVGWAFTTGKVKILSDGTPWRPIVHIEDMARATLLLLEAKIDSIDNEAFNIGANDENYRVSELAEIARDAVPESTIEYASGAGPDPRSYRVDFTKLSERFPDFRFKWTARAGAEQLAAACREVGLTLKQFESHRYTRLKHLQLLLQQARLDGDLRWRQDFRQTASSRYS